MDLLYCIHCRKSSTITLRQILQTTEVSNEKKHRALRNTLTILGAIVLFCIVAAIIGLSRANAGRVREYKYTEDARTIMDTQNQGVGSVEVSTLKLDKSMSVQRASYSFSGRVLVVTRDGSQTVISSVNDDGTDLIEIYRGTSRGGSRLLPFQDNTRILMGDSVLECPEGYNLDNCPKDAAKMVPIVFPDAFVKGANIVDKWTAVIIAPDNEHMAWTIRRSDCGECHGQTGTYRKQLCHRGCTVYQQHERIPAGPGP